MSWRTETLGVAGVVKLGKENYFCSKNFNKDNALVSDRATNKTEI